MPFVLGTVLLPAATVDENGDGTNADWITGGNANEEGFKMAFGSDRI